MSRDFVSRRGFIKALSVAGIGAIAWPFANAFLRAKSPPINPQGMPAFVAHQLRDPHFQAIQSHSRTKIAIIGSGVAGLSAARELQRQGIHDFTVFELEPMIGGNAASGQNAVSAYPWGAHYLPIPSKESDFLYPFLQEENIITGFDENGTPYYNELYLCHDLKERLYINGTWQEGLVPHHGLSKADSQEIERFFSEMAKFKHAKGTDGRSAFAIPVDKSSSDITFRQLDAMTMADYLSHHQFHSPYLHWYVNYCCRDDFGAGSKIVSAWAGIHYFAARRSLIKNDDDDAILVWPEGNGFLVNCLAKAFTDKIKTESLVYNVLPHAQGMAIHYFDAKQQASAECVADYVIMATPRFVAHKLCHADFADCFKECDQLQYAPWLVANVTVNAMPNSRGASLAWDNVSYYNTSVGYIHAKHQSLSAARIQSVLTYYRPLDELPPKEARQTALHRDPHEWQQIIMNDFENMHEGIGNHITDIQYRLLGHGMICPTPNLITTKRQQLNRSHGRLFFAHSDMSGLSLFEEAYWQGLQTANALLATLKAHS